MRNTILAILLGLTTAAWAVTYKPYMGAKNATPRTVSSAYDMPDFQFYSTSMYQSAQGYGTRVGQNNGVRIAASTERIGLDNSRSSVGAGFNILGNTHEKKKSTIKLLFAGDITMRSTSAMLSSSESVSRQNPAQGSLHPTGPRKIINPDDDDDDDEENGMPVGDALLPMLLMALAYCLIRTGKRRTA